MHLESHTVHCAEVEALPLACTVLIVETCDVLRVVLNARHLASIRLRRSGDASIEWASVLSPDIARMTCRAE